MEDVLAVLDVLALVHVPEALEILELLEIPAEGTGNTKEDGRINTLPRVIRWWNVPETFDEPELIEYKLAEWATRVPIVSGACK